MFISLCESALTRVAIESNDEDEVLLAICATGVGRNDGEGRLDPYVLVTGHSYTGPDGRCCKSWKGTSMATG
jgi:hypothetical protein